MERGESGERNFAGQEEVTKIGSGEVAAGVAGAGFVDGARVLFILRLFDDDAAGGGEQVAVTGVAGGKDAIHHVDAAGDVFGEFVRHANAHDVAGAVFGKELRGEFGHFKAEGSGLADGEAADGVTVGVEIEELSSAVGAEVGEHGALDDGEAERFAGGSGAVVRISLAGPADGPVGGGSGGFVAGGIFEALVEDHHDVAAEGELDIDGGFGGEHVRVAVEVGSEENAFFGDLAEGVEAEDLESAGIGENSAGPGHKFVESAELTDGFVAGAEEEVIGVGQDDFGVEVVEELGGEDAFDRCLSANGHEDRGFDGAVGGVEDTGSGAGGGAGGLEVEAEHEFIL